MGTIRNYSSGNQCEKDSFYEEIRLFSKKTIVVDLT